MNIIFKTVFGSHLYGLNTPSSDTDFKAVYIPTAREIVLNTAPDTVNQSTGTKHSKNTVDDVDYSIYSLRKFLKLACIGDAVAMDMLHSKENLLGANYIWDYIQTRRTSFYSKDMSAYAGYVKKQCAKYGIKGSKLNELENLIKYLFEQHLTEKVKNVTLPEGQHCFYVEQENKSTKVMERFYNVNSKLISENCKLQDVYESANMQYEKYGERARLAHENQDVDWKAVSHALRVSYQLHDIYTEGDFSYPLKQSKYILSVKGGELPYDEVSEELSRVFEEVTQMSLVSSFPDTVDVAKWDDFLCEVYCEVIKKG